MVTGILCAGLALALALLLAVHRRLAELPSAVWWKVREEREAAAPKALDAMKEGVAARVGTSLVALRQYEDNIAGLFRAQVAEVETRARVAERRASEVAGVLGEARSLLRELRDALDAVHALGQPSRASLERAEAPTLPPSEPPPVVAGLPRAVPEGEGDDELTRVGPRPGEDSSARLCVVPPASGHRSGSGRIE